MRTTFLLSFALAIGATTYACGDDGGKTSTFGDAGTAGDGSTTSNPDTDFDTDGGPAPSDAGADAPPVGTLLAVIRDFKKYDAQDPTTNPDFENVPTTGPQGQTPYEGPWTEASPTYYAGAEYPIDIVTGTLGADQKPVYNTAASYEGSPGRTATTHGKAFFDQWYRDTPGVNVTRVVPIELTKNDAGVYSYDSAQVGVPLSNQDPRKQFFPIDDGTPYATDDAGFGDQGNPHNYHFTVELHTRFTYRGNETFKFSGDDDVFVFINEKLVIDIGGIHNARQKEVSLPDMASALGLEVGKEYPLDFFQAERHVVESNLRIDTTLELSAAPVK